MRSHVMGLIAISVAIATAGCAGATWNVKAGCKTDGDCSIEGSIGGTIPGGGGQNRSLAARMLTSTQVLDAADFEIDVSGSTISYPSTGKVTLTLKDRSTGAVQAARQFDWVRTNNILRLDDPDAVNVWAASEGGSANDLSYKLARFDSAAPPGEHVISTKSKYLGQVTATSTSHFSICTPYPSPYPCMQ